MSDIVSITHRFTIEHTGSPAQSRVFLKLFNAFKTDVADIEDDVKIIPHAVIEHTRTQVALNQPVRQITEFGTKLRKHLTHAGYHYIGQVIRKTERELLFIPGLGRQSINQLKAWLARHQLSLGMDVGPWQPPSSS